MKKRIKFLAIALAISLVTSSAPVYAAPRNVNFFSSIFSNSWLGSFFDNIFNNIRDDLFGGLWGDDSEESPEERPEELPEERPEELPEDSSETVTTLDLVEDNTTVDNGDLLRASTYSLRTTTSSSGASTYSLRTTAATDVSEEESDVKYFPVTMYDYDATTINAATDALDNDHTVREGLYFSNGAPTYTTNTSTGLENFVAGQYYIQNIRAAANNVGCWLAVAENTASSSIGTKIMSKEKIEEATLWTLEIEDGNYYLSYDGKYLVVGTNGDTDGVTDTKTPITLSGFLDNANGVQLSQNGYYLCQWGGVDKVDYGGYDKNNDGGNGMLFYSVDASGNVSATPVTRGAVETSIVSGYEEWNRWDKASGSNAAGDLIYTGLAKDELKNDQIEFNVNEGGIFNDDTNVKNIYDYVGLPFVIDEYGMYIFNSDKNGVYFADEDGDGKADPKSGTKESVYNLYLDEGTPQPLPPNTSVGDGSTNAWFPYNIYTTDESDNKTYKQNINYHFGMRADIPFSMTANGRIKSTDDNSTPITFSFSGDDDVWVYIDGKLVIDLGGIHNRLDVKIDFAANTITYSEANGADNNVTTGSYNDANFATTQKLFTDSEGVGLLNMTREEFATNEKHELSMFYLERGEGTSNCQIQFNLPMHDTVLVTKDATKSWNRSSETEGTLTDAEKKAINAIDFGFTLYKKTSESSEFASVANMKYHLINKDGEILTTASTDANGHFYLKNGQTAKFVTEIPNAGATYYVVEDKVPDGFFTPDFNYSGVATDGYHYTDGNTTNRVSLGTEIPEQEISYDAAINKSYEVTAYGSVESIDSLEFICSNYLDAAIPNPSIYPNEDIIVIDYGLPVQIDPLANDVYRGNTIDILYVGSEDVTLTGSEGLPYTTDDTLEFGTVAIEQGTGDSRDTLVYTLNKPLTEVEILTYVVKVTDEASNAVTGANVQSMVKTGKIYIVPATTMYYEEDFTGLVTFTGKNWTAPDGTGPIVDSTYKSPYQEPGVVGTVNDSTYGSDEAYLYDSQDSNGTSYRGDTTTGAIRFSYTFTGTGTSFFARTSSTTGQMQVKFYSIKDGVETLEKILYRDTYYCDTNGSAIDASGTLYNIPVYTESDLTYGTYKVVVTIAKAGTAGAGGEDGSGNEFYLDGIRIMEPLNKSNTTVINTETNETITDKALSAYATDEEDAMEVITLRDKMITDAESDTTSWNFFVFTDTDGQIMTAENYKNIGPKEEVYLEKGQSVSFSIKGWNPESMKLYLGMKAPFGTAAVQVGEVPYNLQNATDCYYDITNNYTSLVEYEQNGVPYYVATYTLKATDSLVSLTNIKATGNDAFTFVSTLNTVAEGEGEDTL